MTTSDAELPLTELEQHVERCVLKLKGRVKHCGRNAYRHLRRAWALRETMPEMALFSVLTAEEEAATALILAIKTRNYTGAEKLNHRSHPHKAAIVPFLRAAASVFEQLNYAAPHISIQQGDDDFKIAVRLDFNKLIGRTDEKPLFIEPVPPLHFVMQDQNGPIDFTALFAKFTETKGITDVFEFVKREANFRNKLLYASDDGIAYAELPENFFSTRIAWITVLFVILLLVEQSPEPQLFVSQCLDALLRILQRIDTSQFEYEAPGEEDFNGIFVEKIADKEPVATFRTRHTVKATYEYRWLPGWVIRFTPNTTSK